MKFINKIKKILFIGTCIIIFSCTDLFLTEKEIECIEENPEFTYIEDIKPILENNCTVCHNIDNRSGGLSLSSYNDFNLSTYIVPGDNSQGAIIKRITNQKNPMPPTGLMVQENIDIIKTWILECAIEN